MCLYIVPVQALNTSGDGPAASLALLRSRIDAAEQGGVPTSHPTMAAAQHALRRLLAADARDALELALKQPTSGRDGRSWERQSALRTGLAKAEEVLGAAVIASVCQDAPASSREGSATSAGGADADGDAGTAARAAGRANDAPGAADASAAPSGELLDTQGSVSDGVASMISVTISDDDADMAMLLELARRARIQLDKDVRELARQDAEREAAERERREKQDKERARVEQVCLMTPHSDR